MRSKRFRVIVGALYIVGAVYLVALALDISLGSRYSVKSGWFSVVDNWLGLPIVAAMTLGPAVLVTLIMWRLVFGSRRVGVLSGVVLFIVGSVSSCGFYGHAGPAPVVMWILMGYAGLGSIIWMATTGFLVTGLFGWWSRRRHIDVVQQGSVTE
jgi:hypothetical protein